MIRSAREVNVITDFSKLGRRSVSRIGPFDRIRRLFTDNRAPQEFTEGLRKRSEEHTSELQSRLHIVCRLMLAKETYVDWCTVLSCERHDADTIAYPLD